jgi:hypothetical protein
MDVLECTGDGAHGERVVAAEGEREGPVLRMLAHGLRDGLAHAAHEPRVLEDADGRVVLLVNGLELVVAVELDVPAEALELLDEAGLHEMDRAGIDAGTGLHIAYIVVSTPLTDIHEDEDAHLATTARESAGRRKKKEVN